MTAAKYIKPSSSNRKGLDEYREQKQVIINGIPRFVTKVTKRMIHKDCIVLNEVFFNSNVTRSNSLGVFEKAKTSLKYNFNVLTFICPIKNKTDYDNAYESTKAEILRHKGCLITDSEAVWQKLTTEMLELNKEVYLCFKQQPNVVYICFNN